MIRPPHGPAAAMPRQRAVRFAEMAEPIHARSPSPSPSPEAEDAEEMVGWPPEREPSPSPDSVHAMTLAGNHRVPRAVPKVHRVSARARQPIEPPSFVEGPSRPADTIDRRQWQAQLEHHGPQPGLMADLPTMVLQPPAPVPWHSRAMGNLRAGVDWLRPAETRHIKDSRRAAAWLRDNGQVALDEATLKDVVVHQPREGSHRLERLGFLQAHPNLNERHAAAIQEALVHRHERQADGSAVDESLTREIRRVLPKGDKRRPR